MSALNIKTFRVSTGHCLSLLGQQAGSNQILADLFENPVHLQTTLASPRNTTTSSAAGAKVKPPPPAPPAKVLPQYRYFVSVSTQGIGGEYGWGVIGDNVERAIGSATSLLDSALTRLQSELTTKDAKSGVMSGKTVTIAGSEP